MVHAFVKCATRMSFCLQATISFPIPSGFTDGSEKRQYLTELAVSILHRMLDLRRPNRLWTGTPVSIARQGVLGPNSTAKGALGQRF